MSEQMMNRDDSHAALKDTMFYMDCVTFLVEGVLFKVPRFKFERSSSVFSDMFAIPAEDSQEGSSDDKPIRLELIEQVDFQRFLSAMFPDYTLEPLNMGRKEWISVLKLSTLWQFGELRQEAISQLSGMALEATEKISLARAYRVERWLLEGYSALVHQEAALTTTQKDQLGAETTILLYEKREDTFRLGAQRLRSQLGQNYSAFGSGFSVTPIRVLDNLETDLRAIFQEEIRNSRYEGDEEYRDPARKIKNLKKKTYTFSGRIY